MGAWGLIRCVVGLPNNRLRQGLDMCMKQPLISVNNSLKGNSRRWQSIVVCYNNLGVGSGIVIYLETNASAKACGFQNYIPTIRRSSVYNLQPSTPADCLGSKLREVSLGKTFQKCQREQRISQSGNLIH